MEKKTNILTGLFLGVLAGCYGYWALTGRAYSAPALIVSALVCLLFGWCGVRCIRLVMEEWNGYTPPDPKLGLGRRSLRRSVRHPVIRIFLAVLLSRLLVYVLAYGISTLINGYQGGILDTISLWNKGDAPHYLGIAEQWYVNEGDARFHIVFFPFYPVLVRILNAFLHNSFFSGLILSNLFAALAGVMLYELALLDMDRSSARRAVKFQFLLPAAFLFCAPMSDSLFLLLSVTCLYLMRKEQFLAACLMAGLAAFTRVQGVLLIAPLLMEMIRHCLNERRVAPETFRPWRHVGRFTSLLVVLLGFGLYLYINYDVTGNPLQFLTYQKEHWNQQLGWFFNTAAYQTEELVLCSVNDLPQALGLWLPNLIALLGGLVLVLPALRFTPKTAEELLQEEETPAQEAIRAALPLRASYGLYYLVYYFFSMGATWLLSAPRYLACAVPLSLALALVTKKRWVNGLMTILLLVLQVLYLAAYVQGWHVY